jgi:hypothetical protein
VLVAINQFPLFGELAGERACLDDAGPSGRIQSCGTTILPTIA